MRRLIISSVIVFNLFTTSCTKIDDLNSVNNAIDEVSTTTDEILQLVNVHRKSIGKSDLIRNSIADKIAEDHTNYMIVRGKISHDNFSARFVALQQQVNARAAGENVAYGYANGKTVMDGWLNSSGHKANIEGDYTHMGVAAIKDANGQYYFTQIFYR